ncbi:MAG: DEAD/DEAH box helicase, partial [Acidimicrobiales bacterium]|nr:DEAD/DEAH box helicase [Acidimicrobiales bacterium]
IDGTISVSVSLTNETVVAGGRTVQDLTIYDARMSISVAGPWVLQPQRLRFAEGDIRYDDVATVAGRGRGCVAYLEGANGLRAETLPFHTQQIAAPNTHGASLGYSDIAADPFATLDPINTAMRRFLRDWDTVAVEPAHAQQLELKKLFEAEIDRFEAGIDLLRNHPDLLRSFKLANTAMLNASTRPNPAWRLFQLVFIVSQVASLVAREHPDDPKLLAELETVDVLWFPTGGGKTEAYFGLILAAMFYDRFRGKHRGITAWLLFPLRMLSVQQLARLMGVVYSADKVRSAENVPGDAFTVGYFVGAGNTPNRLAATDASGWWPGLDAFARRDEAERDERRVIGGCPACGLGDSVGLDVDLTDQRLVHVCRTCKFTLPIHISDDEVMRYQSTVVVSTVDKVTAVARNGELTAVHHGPRMQCPQHGYFSHHQCIANGCTQNKAWVAAPAFKDPPPALWVQDELHLVREELGVFAAHYHTLLAELARGAGHQPSKVITATATIEQFEDQLSQVYGRRPRMFPSGGPTVATSFYSADTDDVRRVYLGVLPSGGGTVKVDLSGQITTLIVDLVHQLALNPAPLLAAWAADGLTLTATDAADILFNYELALAYVNSKAHGVHISDDIGRLTDDWLDRGYGQVEYRMLTGDTQLGELAAAVNQVQSITPATPPYERVRAIVATSVVSHGVDLDRLNFEIVAGMPSTYAGYIQITARAGRSHVGLVIPVFDRVNRREASMYHSFATTHAALDRMVEPVPVNRFASRAVQRTLPGIICALLWDETRNPGWPSIDSISQTRKFRAWWNAHSASFLPTLTDRIAKALSCPVTGVVDSIDQATLTADALQRWETVERLRMQSWQSDWLTGLFTTEAMTSLRDVDTPVEFGAGNRAGQIHARLLG